MMVVQPRQDHTSATERELDELLRVCSQGARKRKRVILLVDDDRSIRALTREFLERAGNEVLEAVDGSNALAICAHHHGPIDLLLTDIEMPGGSGFDLATQVVGLRPAIAVLLMSGGVRVARSHLAKLSKNAQFIGKPFTRLELHKAVEQATALDASRGA